MATKELLASRFTRYLEMSANLTQDRAATSDKRLSDYQGASKFTRYLEMFGHV